MDELEKIINKYPPSHKLDQPTWGKDAIKQMIAEAGQNETLVICSLNDEIEKMSDLEALKFVNEIEKWCYTLQNDKPSISLNGIKKAIDILEGKRQ